MKTRLNSVVFMIFIIVCNMFYNDRNADADISIVDSRSPSGCFANGSIMYYCNLNPQPPQFPNICWQQATPEEPELWNLWGPIASVQYDASTQPPIGYLDSWSSICEQQEPPGANDLSLFWITTDPWMPMLTTSYELVAYCGYTPYPLSNETGRSCGIIAPAHSSANLKSGNLYFSQDVGGLSISFNSAATDSAVLGYGWTHSFNIIITTLSNGALRLQEGDGNNVYFGLSNDGIYRPSSSSGDKSSIVKNADGSYIRTMKDGTIHAFNSSGKISAITDRNGNSIMLTYNGTQLASITSFDGRQMRLSTSSGRITAITDPAGSTFVLTYSGSFLTSIADPVGQAWRFTYDANGNMLTKTDPAGNKVTYTYDIKGKYLSSSDPDGKTRSLSYSASTNTSTFTEKDGGIWGYQYDPTLHVTTMKTDPLGNVTRYTYDSNRNLLSETDPAGNTTTFTYDSAGNRTSVKDAMGQMTTYTYNGYGQVTSETDPSGNVTTYLYDDKGNLLSITDPAGAKISYTYDTKGNKTSTTDAKNQVTRFTYDQYNDITSITDPLGAVTVFMYDNAGNMVGMRDNQGAVTEYRYNNLNQLIQLKDPLGNVTAFTYDPNGNQASVTDGNGNTTAYTYNYHGQVKQGTDALGKVTAFSYGGTGCSACGGGADKLTAVTDAKSHTTTYQYDKLGHLIKETDALGKATSYTYDSRGNLTTRIDALGNKITYSYDALNRLIGKSYPDGSLVTFEYDAIGNLIYTENDVISYTLTYDVLNRLIQVTDSDNRTVEYTYDVNSNRLTLTDPLGRQTLYEYNPLNQLTALQTPEGPTLSMSYDTLGRRIGVKYPNGLEAASTYDTASNLSSLSLKNANATLGLTAYAYDKAGNRTAALATPSNESDEMPPLNHYTYDAGNRLLDDGIHLYGYDNKGNLTSKTNKTTAEVTTYTWDYEGRLTSVQLPDGTTAQYAYDPFGRRIEKNVNGIVTKYLYDRDAILLEYDQDGNVVRSYTHGLRIDEPLMVSSESGSYYYHTDALGSITSITDSAGAVVQQTVYDAYGKIQSGNTLLQPYAYTGREYDAETGLYYYRARYYDPAVGRFLSPDPIGLAGGINLYGYALNNPINWIDPYGLSPADVIKLLTESRNFTDQMTRNGERTDPGVINNLLISCRSIGICENNYNGCGGQSDALKDHLDKYMNNNKLDDKWNIEKVYNLPVHYNLRATSSNQNDPVLILDPHAYKFGAK